MNHAVQKLESVIKDKDVSKLIREVRVKVDRIEELLGAMDEVSSDDIDTLRDLSKKLHKIASDFE